MENLKAVPVYNLKESPDILRRMGLSANELGCVSDGYHTFDELYYHRLVLFATLCNLFPTKAWKSKRHHDGEIPFGGGWFIAGIQTPEGQYTYHYELKDWDLFRCKELPCAVEWDGHVSSDATRLLSLTMDSYWISVTDRLPEENEDALYLIRGVHVMDEEQCYRGPRVAYYRDKTWWWREDDSYPLEDIFYECVTHWMPIPMDIENRVPFV